MSKNILVEVKQTNKEFLPFKSGYYLGACIHDKLGESPLGGDTHDENGWSPYTLSRALPTDENKEFVPEKGIKTEIWAFLFRSLDENIIQSLRGALTINPHIRLRSAEGRITGVKELEIPDFKNSVKFETRSPILLYDKDCEEVVGPNDCDYAEEMKNTIINRYQKETGKDVEGDLKVLIDDHNSTQVKVSSKKNVYLPAYEVEGVMKGPADVLRFAYLGGIGSSTALGLGCWEVIQ